MTDLDFDINKFDFEDLHKKILKFNYKAYLRELGKPKTFTISGTNGKNKIKHSIGFEIRIEEDSIVSAVIDSILSKTEYKKHSSLISNTYHKVIGEEKLKQVREILLKE